MNRFPEPLDPAARIAELNLLFIALLEQGGAAAGRVDDAATRLGLTPEQLGGLRRLDVGAKRRLALSAPVALFSVRFDASAFRARFDDRLDPGGWLGPQPLYAHHAFVITALTAAWHLARSDPEWLPIGFGLEAAESELLRELRFSQLPTLAPGAADSLRARFADRRWLFWPRAMALAAATDADSLRLAAIAALHMASAEQRRARR